MSYYNCHFELIIQVEDPDGINLNERMIEMVDELNKSIREKHPCCIVLPRGFEITTRMVADKQCQLNLKND